MQPPTDDTNRHSNCCPLEHLFLREKIIPDSHIIVGKINFCTLYKHRFSVYYLSYTICYKQF